MEWLKTTVETLLEEYHKEEKATDKFGLVFIRFVGEPNMGGGLMVANFKVKDTFTDDIHDLAVTIDFNKGKLWLSNLWNRVGPVMVLPVVN